MKSLNGGQWISQWISLKTTTYRPRKFRRLTIKDKGTSLVEHVPVRRLHVKIGAFLVRFKKQKRSEFVRKSKARQAKGSHRVHVCRPLFREHQPTHLSWVETVTRGTCQLRTKLKVRLERIFPAVDFCFVSNLPLDKFLRRTP